MLTTLLHSGVGEVAVVVTRYFGGVKLGKGGLSRAYSAAVAHALERLPTQVRLQRVERWVEADYPHLDGLFRLLEELGGERVEEEYGAAVRCRVAVPVSALDQLERGVAGITGGAGRLDIPASAEGPVRDLGGDPGYRSEEGPDGGSGRSA